MSNTLLETSRYIYITTGVPTDGKRGLSFTQGFFLLYQNQGFSPVGTTPNWSLIWGRKNKKIVLGERRRKRELEKERKDDREAKARKKKANKKKREVQKVRKERRKEGRKEGRWIVRWAPQVPD